MKILSLLTLRLCAAVFHTATDNVCVPLKFVYLYSVYTTVKTFGFDKIFISVIRSFTVLNILKHYYNLKKKYYIFNIFLKEMYSCEGKAEFSTAITSIFSVT